MSAYFVFSEAHEPLGTIGNGEVTCRICTDLGLVETHPAMTMPDEPTPIDVPDPPEQPELSSAPTLDSSGHTTASRIVWVATM